MHKVAGPRHAERQALNWSGRVELAPGAAAGGITMSGVLDGVQMGLDVLGMVPAFGEIADGINALIYLGRGDYVNAGLSAGAMLPFAGWAATAGKFALAAAPLVKVGKKVPDGSFYSVAFEVELPPTLYPGVERGPHFASANTALKKAMDADPDFAAQIAKLGIEVPFSTKTGLGLQRSPANWTWHHEAYRPGVMQLVPRAQHTKGSIFWRTMHPWRYQGGGMVKWGR